MAEISYSLGYQCELIDSVHDHFYCKKCSLLARRLTFTTCCGESYCHACIADIQQQDKPCPQCGQQNFTTMKPLKHQQQMDSLKVRCSMRDRGCSWSGPLGQIDNHLDPEQNLCQHVDVKCPLHCQQSIPRNKVEQHLASECGKRDHVCKYCGFRATYEVVVDIHWTECIYFPLQCPNFCGVTCERDVMVDHMSTCRLEEVVCEFSGMGCGKRFRREDQEEHARQNNHLHLTMIATAAMKIDQKFQHILQEQEGKLQQQEDKIRQQEGKLQQQEEKLQQQEGKLREQAEKLRQWERKIKNESEEQERKLEEEKQKTEKELQQQEQKLENFERKFEEQELKFSKQLEELDHKFVELQEKSDQNKGAVKDLEDSMKLIGTFAMKNFKKEKKKDKPDDWKSPAMYTHVGGYKFCVGIDANGCGRTRGKAMVVYLLAMQGEYDHQLKWPAQARFTVELLNQHGGENIINTTTNKVEWEKPTQTYKYMCLCEATEHFKLKEFLANDTLNFQLSNITVY